MHVIYNIGSLSFQACLRRPRLSSLPNAGPSLYSLQSSQKPALFAAADYPHFVKADRRFEV